MAASHRLNRDAGVCHGVGKEKIRSVKPKRPVKRHKDRGFRYRTIISLQGGQMAVALLEILHGWQLQ
jgi:hypothetical protein